MTMNLQPLDKKLRNKLERTVKEARDVAEEGARAACRQLGVGRAKPDDHLTDDEKDLRRRLRIHGRQLGDKRDSKKETQHLDRLVDEIAYEHWHRMLFARFLAENGLLMYPDPDDPVAVSLEDCEELAADEGAKNGWELAARFAARMLPHIFRLESPVFSLDLPPENQQQLERLLSDLPEEVFMASDSLGWVYQFWQAKRKDEVNASEVKIGARELPAVTQLFTEPYMVSFLLDNSLGAWWAARRLSKEDLRTADSEQELRDKASLLGMPLEYLRFVRDEEIGCWTPAAGTFDSWPESLAELKTLDPCCGSGHFLVAALLMLVPMRMELEGLSAREAVDRVLSENLHGLEIDQRCVELAAFALALTAWRYPDLPAPAERGKATPPLTAGEGWGEGKPAKPLGYRQLPDLNIACCGLSISVPKVQWKKLAGDDKQLRIALDWMYDELKDAPVLGSLLNPMKSMAAKVVTWGELSPILRDALTVERTDERREAAIVAHGLASAAILLADHYYYLVMTNVPYLGVGKHNEILLSYIDDHFSDGKSDLATAFVLRALDCCCNGGTFALVAPQSWLYLKTYRAFRKQMLRRSTLHGIATLGEEAWSSFGDRGPRATLLIGNRDCVDDDTRYFGIKASTNRGESPLLTDEDTSVLKGEGSSDLVLVSQVDQLDNPDSRIGFEKRSQQELLMKFAYCYQGTSTGDNPRFIRDFLELPSLPPGWQLLEAVPNGKSCYTGKENVVNWEAVESFEGSATRGDNAFDRSGVIVGQMNSLPASIYLGQKFGNSTPVVIPDSELPVTTLWTFLDHETFGRELRKINPKRSVDNGYVGKIPFDLSHWQKLASEKYPYGLPQPYSDDPTQWLFHGHPASAENALHVAVARLLGYRWPAELDEEMELATDARVWIERSGELVDSADEDGIVCIPAVGTEQPAEDRLLNLLHKAYEAGRKVEKQFLEKLDAGDTDDPLTLDLLRREWQPSLPGSFNDWLLSLLEAAGHKDKTLGSWLRDKFFKQHCKLFHNRPFIWHT